MTRDKKIELAAQRFFELAFPCAIWGNSPHQEAQRLIKTAFALYDEEWRGRGRQPWDVRGWKYPADTLKAGEPFAGDQPWTVLLRRAVELAQEPTP